MRTTPQKRRNRPAPVWYRLGIQRYRDTEKKQSMKQTGDTGNHHYLITSLGPASPHARLPVKPSGGRPLLFTLSGYAEAERNLRVLLRQSFLKRCPGMQRTLTRMRFRPPLLNLGK